MKRSDVTPVRTAIHTESVDGSVRWLIGISLLCVTLVFGLRWYFGQLEVQIKQRGDNERARLFVGEEIVRGVREIEKDIYRMAVTQNVAGFTRINTEIETHLQKLQHDLNVLKSGGTSRREMLLNLEGTNEISRSATYYPGPDGSLVMELIEIEPQIGQIRDRARRLEALLSKRWDTLEREDGNAFLAAEEEVVIQLKQIPPQFERINENANRLFVEGDQRLRLLEAELSSQSQRLQSIETGLISLVVLLGAALAVVFMRRLTAALQDTRRARDETESQREQNATILDTLSDGVYATDLDGTITYVNAAAERITGLHAADLVGRHSHAMLHHSRPDGSPFPEQDCPLIAVLQRGVTLDGEDHFIHRDGHFIPVSFRSKPLLLKGQVVGSLLSFHDITDRLESEARIRLQQAALNAAANMILITNRAGLIEYVNPAFCETTGFSAQEVIGRPTSILNSGLQDAEFYAGMWQTLLAGRSWEGELNNRRKDGSIYTEQMTVTPIIEHDDIAHFVAIKRDITEDVQTRTQLKLIESAIQETNQAIVIMDAQAHPQGALIHYVNAGFSRITGYSAGEAVGMRSNAFYAQQTDPYKIHQIHQAMTDGASLTLEMQYRRRDDSLFLGELHLSPVHTEQGRASHYIGLLNDIDLRKQAELALREARDQALENSRLKSEFLSTMSHEIRTPMNGIIGMTDLLLDTPLNEEQRDFTGIVRDSAHALLVIINDILDFSKIEAGKLEVEITDFSASHVVEGTVELLGAKAREKKLTLSSFVDPALPPRLMGDPTRLRQVLLNMIGNGIKFTETGGVEVSAMQDEASGEAMIRFEVVDTGIGISKATQTKLFQSFTQADSSTTRKYGGTGLGLAICKRLVELMGGQVGIHSDLGRGSTFWFTLPLLPAPISSGSVTVEARPVGSLAGKRVLVVDDHSNDRRVIHRYLSSWEMFSDGASNALEALKLLQDALELQAPYDIALIDYVMPGMDGIELARQLRADQRFDSLRMVMLSAHLDQRELCVKALDAGYAACLTKPIRQSQLFNSLLEHALEPEAWQPSLADQEVVSTDLDATHRVTERRLILLAEDNLVNQKVAQLQVSKLGYELHIVDNGQQALQAVLAAQALKPYAAILMDCQMPVMDGFEATAAIRAAQASDQAPVPIIAMTANAMQGDRQRCLAAGMDDYLSKPIKPAELSAALNKWAGKPALSSAVTDATSTNSNLPTPTRSDNSTVIDFGLLDDYFGDDPQVLARLLALFQSSSAQLLQRIGAAIEEEDAQSIHALAHELKGSCGNIGIERMADVTGHLETASAELDWPEVAAQFTTLQAAFEDVCVTIAQHHPAPS